MGGRGSGSNMSGGSKSVIDKANAPIDANKAGASFRNLSPVMRYNIQENMKLSQVMQEAIADGKTNITDEWSTGLRGDRIKAKVVTAFDGKRINYTVKQGNKILLRSNDKNQTANKIAEFYLSRSKRR